MKLAAKRILLVIWILLIIYPVAGLGWLYPGLTRRFNDLFHSNTAHVLLHAVLFAGLVIILLPAINIKPGPRAVAVAALAVLVVAGLQEGLQALSQGFFPLFGTLFDLGVDILGGAVGYGVYDVLSLSGDS